MAAERAQFPTPTTQFPIGPLKTAVLIFVSSESILFLTVVAQYAVGQAHNTGPTPREYLDVPRMFGFSIALWLSSATMQLAPHSLRRHGVGAMRAWMAGTFVLGLIFLVGEAQEWLGLFQQQISASRNIWASTLFSLTGIHGLHVCVGLLFMLGLVAYSFYWPISHSDDSGLEALAIYWHFVDGMWVIIFGTVYFWSAFLGG